MAVTRRRSKLWWRIPHQSKALDEIFLTTIPKRDLKQSGTFLFSKKCMRPWIRSLWNILPKRPLRDEFLAQNTIWSVQKVPAGLRDDLLAQNAIVSAQRAPAGRFSGSKYNFVCPKGSCGMLFRLKIQFYPQKLPAGRFSSSKCNFIHPKGPSGTLFRLNIQFDPPKRLLRDAL